MKWQLLIRWCWESCVWLEWLLAVVGSAACLGVVVRRSCRVCGLPAGGWWNGLVWACVVVRRWRVSVAHLPRGSGCRLMRAGFCQWWIGC